MVSVGRETGLKYISKGYIEKIAKDMLFNLRTCAAIHIPYCK